MSALALRARKQFYRGRRPGFRLDVELEAPPGFTVLFGPSGSGKSTVLDCVAGLLAPDAGRVAANGEALFDSAARIDLPPARRRVGYVFQQLALFPHMTAEENVGYGLLDVAAEERRARVHAILESFGIAELARQRPDEISGGQRQRVALARAVVTNPRVLLLDEPLTGLDDATKEKLLADLRRWNAAHRVPVLYVTHDRDEVRAIGERVVRLRDGRIED